MEIYKVAMDELEDTKGGIGILSHREFSMQSVQNQQLKREQMC
jgi:hypothetical protein